MFKQGPGAAKWAKLAVRFCSPLALIYEVNGAVKFINLAIYIESYLLKETSQLGKIKYNNQLQLSM